MVLVSIIFLLVFTFVFSMQCIPNIWTYEEAKKDSSVFRTVALLMDNGFIPYRDTFDHEGPLVYLINWLGMQIGYYKGIWWIEYIVLLFTFMYIYKIIRIFCGRWISYGMMLTVVASLYPLFDGGNETEEYAMPFLAVALYIYIKFFLSSYIHSLKVILCGICFGVVILLRPNMVTVWGVFSIGVLIKCLYDRQYRQIRSFLMFFLLGIFVVVVPILIWLYRERALNDFIYEYIFFNLRYSEMGIQQKGAWRNAIMDFISVHWILCMMIVIVSLLKVKDDYLSWGHGICLIISLYAITVSGRSYVHYGMVLVPLYAYPFGILGRWLEKSLRKRKGLACIVLYCLGILTFPDWARGITHMVNSYQYREEYELSSETASVVNYIKENTSINEKITVWGNWNIVYVLSHRLPASRYSYQSPIATVDPQIYYEYFIELEEKRPSLIVLKKDGKEKMLLEFIKEYHYKQVFENGGIFIYSR